METTTNERWEIKPGEGSTMWHNGHLYRYVETGEDGLHTFRRVEEEQR